MTTIDFIFICPQTGQTFYTDKFDVIDNRGVTSDAAGHKILDARVALAEPCPFCGGRHVFEAKELSCPFSADKS